MILYTDIDPFCCKWLGSLISAGMLPKGDVLCADMTKIDPESVRKYTQRHWCCGIGGWPEALRIAEWPKDKPIDTMSLPCQPFSVAGKQNGLKDERNIWGSIRKTIIKLKPTTIIGEQVPQAIKLGWLDGIFDDLEAEGYTCGAIVLPACSVGAPHIRQRLWWVADADSTGQSWSRSPQSKERRCGPIITRQSKDISNVKKERCSNVERRSRSFRKDRREINVTNNAGRRRKQWPFEPDMVRVVHGVSTKVGAAVGCFGNSIVPQVGAEFIKAYMSIKGILNENTMHDMWETS